MSRSTAMAARCGERRHTRQAVSTSATSPCAEQRERGQESRKGEWAGGESEGFRLLATTSFQGWRCATPDQGTGEGLPEQAPLEGQ